MQTPHGHSLPQSSYVLPNGCLPQPTNDLSDIADGCSCGRTDTCNVLQDAILRSAKGRKELDMLLLQCAGVVAILLGMAMPPGLTRCLQTLIAFGASWAVFECISGQIAAISYRYSQADQEFDLLQQLGLQYHDTLGLPELQLYR